MKQRLSVIALAIGAVTVFGAFGAHAVRAETNATGDVSTTGIESTADGMKKQRAALHTTQQTAEQERQTADKERLAAEREAAQEAREKARDVKQAAAKKKSCKNRQASIQKIIGRTSTNAQHHFDMITKVADNVAKFATDKKIDMSGFATETAVVAAAKTTAQEALDTAKTTGTAFTCDTDAPKSAASAFLASKKAQAAALKGYRDAVKALLVAVKSSADKTADADTDTTNETTGGAQ